jgi:hypothetical protein
MSHSSQPTLQQYVSSPHPLSNIRLIQHRLPTPQDCPTLNKITSWKKYEEQVQSWHHSFWCENNHHFQTSLLEFEQGKLMNPFDS